MSANHSPPHEEAEIGHVILIQAQQQINEFWALYFEDSQTKKKKKSVGEQKKSMGKITSTKHLAEASYADWHKRFSEEACYFQQYKKLI